MKRILQEKATLLALAAIIIAFGIVNPSHFLKLNNLLNITRQMSLLVMIALGATMVMCVNEFDLSVGGMASLGGIISALLAVNGCPMAVCFTVPLLVAVLVGLVNGFLVARFRVLSFITTLGMNTVLSGVIYRLSGGSTIFQGIPDAFSVPGNAKLGIVPVLSLLMLLFVLLFWLITQRMTLGRRMYAIGCGADTAQVAGIRVMRYRITAFVLSSLMACVCGMLIASRVGSANTTAGDGYFMKAYAAVFIGCTVSRKGVPNALGTLVGAAILGVLANGLTMLQIPTYTQDIVTGGIIILSVILQRVGRGDAR